ncbi:MAG TPA: hypothetical protein VHC97_13180 [Thermoanaerobaculia bacterium]|nr:hypothetical protein [Thermoanaerobaculia bacterium]
MKRAFLPILAAALLVLGLASAAGAQQCTATVNCNNACSVSLVCPYPYPPCEIGCSSPSQTLTCTGASTCSVGTKSVTCDGVTKSCPTTIQCTKGGAWVKCGTTYRQCPNTCTF